MNLSILIYFIPFLLALFCATGGKLTGFKFSETMFWVILGVLAVLGGASWHVGWDWQGYDLYFASIPINGLHEFFGAGYTANLSGLRFEPGFYALAYIVKLLGGTNAVVVAAASVFNLFALSRLVRAVPTNRCFALLFYICFCFIFLHFAMVRQALAVGFAYLACRELIDGGKAYKAMLLVLAGTLFHASALMYLPVLLTYQLSDKKLKLILASVPVFFIATYLLKIDMNAILVGFMCHTLHLSFFSKYYAYVNVDYNPSLRTYALIAFNLPFVLYLVSRPSLDLKVKRLATLTFNATMLMVLAVAIFPSNPSIWRRLLFLAAPLQGVWLANQLLTAGFKERLYVCGITVLYSGSAYVYTVFSSTLNLVPYHSIFSRFLK